MSLDNPADEIISLIDRERHSESEFNGPPADGSHDEEFVEVDDIVRLVKVFVHTVFNYFGFFTRLSSFL